MRVRAKQKSGKHWPNIFAGNDTTAIRRRTKAVTDMIQLPLAWDDNEHLKRDN